MNQTIRNFARAEIVRGLNQLAPENHRVFRLMYGRLDGRRSVEEAEKLPIEKVVEEIPDAQLSLALDQVERTIFNRKGSS